VRKFLDLLLAQLREQTLTGLSRKPNIPLPERRHEMRLKSGEEVVDRYRSHLHLDVVRLLPDALARIESAGRQFLVEEVDFGRPIGETICVPTGSGDEIAFALRPKRRGLSRFVKNREPEPCSSVVVILKAADGQPGAYVLVTAFVGRRPEPEPWDRNAIRTPEQSARAVAFWSSHALVWGSEEIIPGTETKTCPW